MESITSSGVWSVRELSVSMIGKNSLAGSGTSGTSVISASGMLISIQPSETRSA